jgi:hypothetical protein
MAHIENTIFENAERGWISDLQSLISLWGTSIPFDPDHERSQIILVLFGLFLEIGEVQATILQTLHGHNLQTGHDCGLHAYSEY